MTVGSETTAPNDVARKENKMCDHSYVLVSSGWRHVETYKCSKCGEEKTHLWHE